MAKEVKRCEKAILTFFVPPSMTCVVTCLMCDCTTFDLFLFLSQYVLSSTTLAFAFWSGLAGSWGILGLSSAVRGSLWGASWAASWAVLGADHPKTRGL